ncbi:MULTISPECIES: alpha/beta fold hydrolase [Microbacterium]|uniref:alpha/beta fold hydrolase n=1 Tax=Microbacterium TaxID=33882 RepID=UPI002789F21A|nr:MULTISPECIES: alpha/beta fold hydrolase [Microbacterium]MDQ1083889.1 pimeloyl-ACP methyl ester carboxylesterase [Microbacterium sp. SORGH_AS_0344]MDQ1170831.1 pimeloyl-ACP methyl ester carboxylesterase [Microbacterium proteolyticum]
MVTYDPTLPDPRFVMMGETSLATWVLEPVGAARGEVVLCHGTPWSSRVWAQVARELSRDYRVFLWDMPGYGESDRDATVATDLRAQAERLVALLQLWGCGVRTWWRTTSAALWPSWRIFCTAPTSLICSCGTS